MENTLDFLNDLHTGAYKTSSKLVWEKLKNGAHFSKIKIIRVFSTEKEALEYEKKYLTRVDAKRNSKFLNQSNGGGNYTFKQHTEKSKEKISEKRKEYFNPETERGRKNLEENRRRGLEQFNPNTERGRKNLENHRNLSLKQFDINTEEGRRNKEKHSKIKKAQFDINTEEGRKNLEKMKIIGQKRVEIRLQKRINASILGELMFDEFFIKENFLIIDDKNNLRFLWSVYSKLSGFSKSGVWFHKRIGKLNFLHGIKSIKLSEEQECVKIEEIKYILKEA